MVGLAVGLPIYGLEVAPFSLAQAVSSKEKAGNLEGVGDVLYKQLIGTSYLVGGILGAPFIPPSLLFPEDPCDYGGDW